MIKTSYFANYIGDKGVSIANSYPEGFVGEEYDNLKPGGKLVDLYKSDSISKKEYVILYKECILDRLNVEKVYNDLDGKVLLCWEGSNKFCHRFIVAKWLEKNLNMEVKEIE